MIYLHNAHEDYSTAKIHRTVTVAQLTGLTDRVFDKCNIDYRACSSTEDLYRWIAECREAQADLSRSGVKVASAEVWNARERALDLSASLISEALYHYYEEP